MRIMLDTNVLISALLFPSQKFNSIMEYIFAEHELVLSSYVVEELKSVVRRKFPKREADIERLLFLTSWQASGTTCLYHPHHIGKGIEDFNK